MKTTQKNMMKKNNRKVNLRPEVLLCAAFVLSALFYCFTKIGLNSYNITLSVEEQRLAAQVNKCQEQIEELQTEVSNLQDKSRVLGMLEGSVQDNQNNIYIMD